MDTDPNFKEFLESLNAHKVRYLVVGAYAMALHGMPRFTGDLDVWVEPTPENAKRVLNALSAFGFGKLNLAETDLSVPGRIIQLGHPPLRIDILTSITAGDFSKAYPRRKRGDYGGLTVPVIGLKHLLRNKEAVHDAEHV